MTSLSGNGTRPTLRGAWRGLGMFTRVVFLASVLYAIGLIVAAGTVSSGDSVSGYGVQASLTLVQENGAKVLLVVAIPLVGSIIVVMSTLVRRRAGRAGVSVVTWTVAGVLILHCIAGILTVGLFSLPVPLLLFGALGSISERDLRR